MVSDRDVELREAGLSSRDGNGIERAGDEASSLFSSLIIILCPVPLSCFVSGAMCQDSSLPDWGSPCLLYPHKRLSSGSKKGEVARDAVRHSCHPSGLPGLS